MILHMINKTSLKFVGIFVVVIIAALAAIYYANYYFSPEQKALRYYAELERQYREDTYGGKTPEETLQLFIDALKSGDIELASKYFVVEEQEDRFSSLKNIAQNNLLSLIEDLEKTKLVEGNESTARFDYTRYFEGGEVEIQGKKFSVDRGPINQSIYFTKMVSGIWKISN